MEPQIPENRPQISQNTEPVKHSIDWKYQFQQYGSAVALMASLFIIESVYLFGRRGYYDLYIANKVFAGVAAVMLGIVLLIGPLTRWFSKFDKYLQYRKEIGIVAFFLILAHGVSSFFFLRGHFPLSRYITTGLWPFTFGFLAVVVVTIIFSISNLRAMKALGGKMWWFFQSWGVRTVFILTALHVGIMKFPGWISWYQKGGSSDLVHPEWPGAGLIVGWFLAFVGLIRVAEMINKNFGKAVWFFSVVAFPVVMVFTFVWGQKFVK